VAFSILSFVVTDYSIDKTKLQTSLSGGKGRCEDVPY